MFSYELEVISWGSSKGFFPNLYFGYDYNVFFALWSFLNEVSFLFSQVFVLQSVLKLPFPLAILTTNFGDVGELFIVTLLFFLKEGGRLFA